MVKNLFKRSGVTGVFFLLSLFCGLSFSVFVTVYAQDLASERVRPLVPEKKSIYFNNGIFHYQNAKMPKAMLKSIRHSFVASRGYERVVFDFEGEEIPKIYGHIAGDKNKIFIDLFNTEQSPSFQTSGKSAFVGAIDLFPIEPDMFSVEIVLKEKKSVDVFYLSKPTRLVFDIK